jgi:two-component system, NarL family, response regulator DevR
MNIDARRSCVQESARESGAASNGHKERSPVFANGKKPSAANLSHEKLRVWIAAENRLLTDALTRMLAKRDNLAVTTTGESAAEMLRAFGEAHIGVLLLSTSGNLPSDLQIIQQVRAHAPQVRILLLGMSGNEQEFLQCVRAGVSGYLLQDASGHEVLRAIEAVAAGEAVCRGTLCGVLFRYFELETCGVPSAAVRRKLGFSRREQQLIPLLAQGLTNKEIANHFSLSEQTVKNHVYRMKHKIGAEDRLDIVQIYRVQGFLV